MEELFTTQIKIDAVKAGDEVRVAGGRNLAILKDKKACEGTWHKVTKTAFEMGRRVFYVEKYESALKYYVANVVFDAARRKTEMNVFVVKARSVVSPFESVAALNNGCSKCNGTGNMGMISSVRCTCLPS